MMTREEYMAHPTSEKNHRAYYGEIAKAAGVQVPADIVERTRQLLKDGDRHLNRIPLGLWDRMALQSPQRADITRELKARGDFWSLGGGVCVMKEAARLQAEESA
jgi:hypothetical protein